MLNRELLESFLEESGEVMSGLELGVSDLRRIENEASDVARMDRLAILAHRMRGSSGLYGFPQMASLAGLIERVLNSRPELHGETREQFVDLLETGVRVLRSGLGHLQAGGNDHEVGLQFSREGGTSKLQHLLQTMPEAFQMRAPLHVPHPLTEDEGPAVANESNEEQPSGPEHELRAFVQDNGEIWEYFAPEVQEHLASLREQLDQGVAADLNVMFRAAHTIKGSSYMVGLNTLGNFAHRMEDLFGAVRDGSIGMTSEVGEAMLRGLDLLDDMMNVAEGAPLPLADRLSQTEQQLRALATGESVVPLQVAAPVAAETAAPVSTTIRVPAQRLDDLMEQVSGLVAARARVSRLLDTLQFLEGSMQESQSRFQRTVRDFEERYLNPDMVRSTSGPVNEQTPSMTEQNVTQQFAELEFDTYNDLNILSRSITELSADFSEVRRRLTDTVTELTDENEQLGKLVRQLRVDLNQTSRVPFSQATTRLRRWARERQELFELITEGDDLLIESSMLQRIVDPLMHLLTNAVYHGVGDPEKRVAEGKPAKGKVWIRATEVNNFLEITIADDGKGLDLPRIRERTLEKGLRSAQELNDMRDSDVARLILLPGLSTAEAVGNVTGRGVGMDVVATSVRQLGGELLIQTERGVGTAFTMRLPTTQRIMDVLQVQVGDEDQIAALPLNAIRSLRDVPEESIQSTPNGLRVPFENELVPLVDTRAIWGYHPDELESDGTVRLAFMSSLVGTVAVRVTEFGRIEEVSVTPPSATLTRLEYLSGVTVSASGDVLPILEPSGLLRIARFPDAWLDAEAATLRRTTTAKRVMLVDDSLSVRRLVGRMLEGDGFQVVTANDGQEAFDTLQLDPDFDALITDLEMPRMNGYELLTAVRARPDTASLPVMVMTTRAGDKHQLLAFQLGANDYFTKPVNEPLLLRRLNILIEEQRTKGIPA